MNNTTANTTTDGSTAATAAAPSTAGGGEGGQQANAAATGTQPSQSTTPANTEPGTVADLPEWAQKEIQVARKQAAASRVNAKTAEEKATKDITQKIGEAFGLVTTDNPADVEALTAQITEAKAAHQQALLELAVHKAAPAAGADPTALLDSRTFIASLKDTSPDDTDAITGLIREAVKSNPRLGAAQAAGASATDHPGQAPTTVTPEQFRHMGYAERAKLYTTDRASYDALVNITR